MNDFLPALKKAFFFLALGVLENPLAGKSTWLRQRFSEALWLDLLDLECFRFYNTYPERLKKDNILCVPVEDFLKQLHPNRQNELYSET